MKERIISFDVKYEPAVIESIERRVMICREFLADYCKENVPVLQ
jgi:hypothetical protein